MTKDNYEQILLCRLREQQLQYPAMEPQDTVKFVFQAMLGVGHLLSSRDRVEQYILREMEQIPEDPGEPLAEELSPEWCRLHLRRAKACRISPSVIAGMMLDSAASMRFTRQDVSDLCAKWALSGEVSFPDSGILSRIPDETWLPSHSDKYREQYHPAYRVISADWLPYLEVIGRIAEKQAGTDRMLVTIDGPCASGKTTLAQKLASLFGAAVVHTDDYVIPHAQKTAERLAVPGGNCDADRLAGEVTDPWKRGDPVKYRRYDCRADRLCPEETLPDSSVLILEGSYCNLPLLRRSADLRVFLDASWETREERLLSRESAQSMQRFRSLWIPLEDRYFEVFGLPDRDCIVIRS